VEVRREKRRRADLVVEVVAELQQELRRADVDLAVEEIGSESEAGVGFQHLQRDLYTCLGDLIVKEQELLCVSVLSDDQVLRQRTNARALLDLLQDDCHDAVAVLLPLLLVEGDSFFEVHVGDDITIDENKGVRADYPHDIQLTESIALRETGTRLNASHRDVGREAELVHKLLNHFHVTNTKEKDLFDPILCQELDGVHEHGDIDQRNQDLGLDITNRTEIFGEGDS
jgi:hypothetical protein